MGNENKNGRMKRLQMKCYTTEIAANANRAVTIEYKIGHHKDNAFHIIYIYCIHMQHKRIE